MRLNSDESRLLLFNANKWKEGLEKYNKIACGLYVAMLELREDLIGKEFEHNYERIKLIDEAIAKAEEIEKGRFDFDTRTNVTRIDRD